ncbi:MAG: ABC transporter substrate-binding protein [Acetobacteraceae bacterium]
MKRISWLIAGLALAISGAPLAANAQTAKPKSVKIAIVTFFSGSGAVAGGPTVDSAKITVEGINKAGGIDGVPIEVQYVDESGGSTKQVAEFRSLAGHVAAVIGYASSADCLAVEPVAEELHVLTFFSDCDGDALYKGTANEWIFHTIPSDATNALAMAFYIAKMYPHIKTIAGINPDYAYGRDEWKYFTMAMQKLHPGVTLGTALFPALFSGQYTSELSRLQGERPDLILSSTWGGDVVALIQQGTALGSFGQSLFALPAGTEGGVEAMTAVPAGVVFGAEHGWLMHPGKIENPEIAAFVEEYHKQTHHYPVSPYPFTIQRPIFSLVAGYQAAIKANGGHWPSADEVARALVGVHVTTMLGSFEIRSDHVATVPEMDGVTVRSSSYPFSVLNKIIEFPASMLMAPVGESEESWIGKLTPASLANVPAPKEYQP